MDWAYIESVLPLYGKAAWLTLRTGTAGILLATLIGLLCAAALHWKVPVFRRITAAYVELVFQNYELFPHLTVLENILLAPVKTQKRSR